MWLSWTARPASNPGRSRMLLELTPYAASPSTITWAWSPSISSGRGDEHIGAQRDNRLQVRAAAVGHHDRLVCRGGGIGGVLAHADDVAADAQGVEDFHDVGRKGHDAPRYPAQHDARVVVVHHDDGRGRGVRSHGGGRGRGPKEHAKHERDACYNATGCFRTMHGGCSSSSFHNAM